MPQNYTPEFKKRQYVFGKKQVVLTKVSLPSMVQQKPALPSGVTNLVKNAKKALQNPDASNEMKLMKENLRLRKELEEARKENLFLKKAATFFAKEIDQAHIDLLSSITNCWGCVGFFGGLKFIPMHIRRITMPLNQKYKTRSKRSTIHTMVSMVTEV